MLTGSILNSLLVVEQGHRTAAGACGTLLAMLGAEVVLVEPAQARTDHKWRNRDVVAARKRSVLETDPGLASLLRRADVLLLSSDVSGPGSAAIPAAAPSQLVCDLTAFGRTGPLAGRGLPEELVQGWCGVAETTGQRDGPPVVTGAPFVSMEAGAYGAAAIVAALIERTSSGLGQSIDISLYDVGVNALLTFLPLAFAGLPATRNGNRHPSMTPWNSYPGRDGRWVLICAPTNDMWRRLCAVMERPWLAADERFVSTTARLANVEAIDAEIAAWTAGLDAAAIVERVDAAGIPCSQIETLADLHAEPNVVRREMSLPVDAAGARLRVPGNIFRVAGAPWRDEPTLPAGCERKTPRASAPAPGSGPADGIRRGPLQGLRVIEIGMNTVAPLAGRQLGALGADVIKVEPPSGDTNRHNAPLREDGASYVFMLSNTDKRGLVLDLKTQQDRDTLFDLLRTADAVIENLKPGALKRQGLGAEDVLARCPHLVYCSVNGFGFDTAYPGRPALDTVIQAMSGALDVTRVDGMPLKAGISISDQLGGQLGLVAILAGVLAARRTGRGMHFDLAMQDATVWATSMVWNDTAGPRCRVVPVADGHILVGEGSGEGDWREFLGRLTRNEAMQALADKGIQAAPVLTVEEVLGHPHTAARSLLLSVPTPDGERFSVLGCPMRLSRTLAETRATMARLGFVDPDLDAELDRLSSARRAGRPLTGLERAS
ncbi:MAG: CoA transferase [Rhizobiaceae bacterium]|nr:MAG: CoA transferase [Rhizobiaceae bacterium]CAG1016044.1 Acetyl-CoA:oxalate CoA-transferase [Rhizobiaceae bacterium]